MSAVASRDPAGSDRHPREAKRHLPWTTRVDPKYTAPFGVAETHFVAFQPKDDRSSVPNWANGDS